MAVKAKLFVRSAYNYDVDEVSLDNGLLCQDESLAQQNFAPDCDINNIVATFTRTGDLPAAPMSPRFGDFTGICDFHSALNQVLAAQEAFMELPASLRARFGNDPQNLILFLDDPSNREEAEALGLVDRREDLSTPPRAASTAKRSGGVGKSTPASKSSVEPPEGSEEGE